MSKFENDLTTGNVLTKLILFAIPSFIRNLIQSIYTVADMIILGNFAGTDSISAVNTSGQVMIILTNLATGIASGGTVMIGQYLGAGKKEKINGTISSLLIILFGLGLILGVGLIILLTPLLDLLNVPAKAYAEARSYLFVSLAGILFIYGYNALSAIMRGLGDSKTPLVFVSLAGVLNIILDYILIAYVGLGAFGAAIATVFSQGLSMVLCIIYLKRNHFSFDFKLRSFIFDQELFRKLIDIGLPMGLQQVATNFSFLILTAMINYYGGVAGGAAMGVVNKFNSFAILPCVAISSSVSAMISQNVGAGKNDRVKKTTWYGFLLCFAICAVVFAIANLWTLPILRLFGDNAEVLQAGKPYMHAFSFEYASLWAIVGFNSVFLGTGNGWITLVTNLISSFLVRIPMAYILGSLLGFGMMGVAWSIPIATVVGSTVAGIYYFSGVWKKNKII